MINLLLGVNWLGVLAAAVAQFVLGGAWFMGLVGRHYGVALGRTDLDGQRPAPLFIVGPFACSLVVITATAILLRALNIESYGEAVLFGLVIGVGILSPMVVNIAINPNFPRPFFYSVLNVPFFVIGSVLASVILFAMS